MPSVPARALLLALSLAVSPLPLLVPGKPVESDLTEAQVFRIEVEGKPVLVTVEEQGIDVALAVRSPSGPLGPVSTAREREGTETWLIEEEGEHRLEVRRNMYGAPRGRFRIQVEELEDRRRIEAERLMTEAGLLCMQDTGEARKKALGLYGKALAQWQALGRKEEEASTLFRLAYLHQDLGDAQAMLDRLQKALPLFASLGNKARESDVLTYIGFAQAGLGRYQEAVESYERSLKIRRERNDLWGDAVTSQNLCEIRMHLSEWREAIRCYEEVLPLMEKAGDSTAGALNGIAGAYSSLGEPSKARDYYLRSLEQKRLFKDREGEGKVLNNLAVLLADQDRLGEALDYYLEALEVFRKLGNKEWEARVLSNLGGAYLAFGDPRKARDLFQEALPVRQALKVRKEEGSTLRQLGQAQEGLGDRAAAMKSYQQALDIAREIRDRTGEALAVGLLAQGHFNAGDLDKALELFNRSAEIQLALENRAGLAFARQRIGEIETRRGNLDEALKILLEVHDLRRLLEDPTQQAETLTALAVVERQRGRLEAALAYAEEAISLVESVRASVAEPALRASFLASRRFAFDLALGLSMDLGQAEHALALSERARARSLLDMVEEGRTEIREGIPPDLREREESLAYRFAVNSRGLRTASKEEVRKSLRRELNELLTAADRLEDEKRRRNPRYAVLNRRPLEADGIQALLEPDTVLLEFALGEKRSFLWLVTRERVVSFELPARTVIEEAARRSYEDIRNREKKDPEAHKILSHLLFGKVADRLHCRRLVIVPDGALHYIPFAALPDPDFPSVPLVVGHEIVSLPSASVLDVQRRVLARPARAPKAVAILADPVFTAADDRLPKAVPGAPPVQPAPWGRLAATGREAKAIARLLPADQVFLATGPKASRATALSGELAHYRTVHFATHGLIESEVPRSSFLALSILDEKRRPLEGSLGLSDIYNLKLQADLVVLSGCETALGREIRGEGLMGLTQGFLYAGAERVMASLWRVEDRPTAELMIRFYGAHFQEKLPPAAALRAAQLSIRGNPAWQDPFYWAPFVLQGDWR